MIRLRPAAARGHVSFGWLDARHSFSFGNYYDPAHMGFSALRVINEDRVKGGGGFPTHSHANMEILTWVLSGALAHKDSLGSSGTIVPGELQHMSAGSGIAHSEFNASATEPVHLLQIWLVPDRSNGVPRYGQKSFPETERRNRWCLIASPDGADGSIAIDQDARLQATLLDQGRSVDLRLVSDRRGWLQIAGGSASLDGHALGAGDGVAIDGEAATLTLTAHESVEALFFDLP